MECRFSKYLNIIPLENDQLILASGLFGSISLIAKEELETVKKAVKEKKFSNRLVKTFIKEKFLVKKGLWKARRPPFLAWSHNYCAADKATGWWIDPDGRIYPCQHEVGKSKWTGTLSKGIIKKRQEIWKKQRLINDPDCLRCPKLFFCGGHCLSEKMNKKSYPPMHYVFEETMREYVKKLAHAN